MTAALTSRIDAHLEGEISGQVAVGNHIVQNNLDNGSVMYNLAPGETPTATRRAPSRGLPGRRPPDPLGRDQEIRDALDSLSQAVPLEFVGPPGVGKTTLLKYLSHTAQLPAAADGIVYRDTHGESVRDTLQFLWETFYETNVPFVPTEAQLQIDLQDIRAMIVIDDFEGDRSDTDRVMDSLPEASFVFASARRSLWGAVRSTRMRGLDQDASVALIEREIGRPLTGDERAVAGTIADAVEGQPLALLQVAALVSDLGYGLAPLCADLQKGVAPDELARLLIESLDDDQRKVLDLLVTLGATLPANELAELTGVGDAEPIVESLLRLGLIQAHSPRYSATVTAEAYTSPDAAVSWRTTARKYFVDWLDRRRYRTEAVLEEEQAVLAVLRAAARDGEWSDVIRLGRAVEGALLLGRRWGAWKEVLDLELTAARRLGDRAAEAWALHQVGSRALGLGDVEAARSNLIDALEIREDLGDVDGAAVTRHNLGLISGINKPPLWRWGGGGAFVTLPFVFLLTIGVLVGGFTIFLFGALALPDRPPPRPPLPGFELRVEPTRVEFGSQDTGTFSPPRRVTVTNDGQEDVAIGEVSVIGAGAGHFGEDDGCSGAILAPGAQCGVAVRFGPLVMGDHQATLVIARPEQRASIVQLTGEGTGSATKGDLQLDPPSIDFGRVEVGQRSPSRTITVKNVGTDDLDLSAVTLTPGGSQFEMSENCAASLPSGGQCAVQVSFRPSRVGQDLGAVSVAPRDADGTARVSLSGVGTSVTPGRCDLVVPGNQTAGYGTRVSLPVSGRAGSRTTLDATGLAAGLSFRDRGDGTGVVSGVVLAAPGEVPITVTCASGGETVSRDFNLTIVPAELTIGWARPLLDLTTGPATAVALVTKPAGSEVDLGSVRLAFEFTNVLSGGTTVVTRVPDGVSGTAAPDLAPGQLPIGVYRVRLLLAEANPYFVLKPSTPPTALVVNTDLLGATVYALSGVI